MTKAFGSGRLGRVLAAWLFWPALALAAIVTIADVANAIRNSPTASAFLKAHADEIGALAIRVESNGDTTAYNGSCCYGILQLNTANILASGSSVSQYRYASLQDQVNAWSMIESQALRDPVIQQLTGMSSFDGHTVDAAMVIACVQLGQGNCRTMVNSGRCDGFRDSNGTTICSMAAQMNAAMSGTGTPSAGTGSGSGSAHGSAGGGSYSPVSGMAPEQAFQQGSGVSMSQASEIFKSIVAAFFVMWLAWTAAGTWGGFTTGRHTLPDLTQTLARATVVVMMVIWLLN